MKILRRTESARTDHAQVTDEELIADLINNGKGDVLYRILTRRRTVCMWTFHGALPDETSARWQGNKPIRFDPVGRGGTGNDRRSVREETGYASDDDSGERSA